MVLAAMALPAWSAETRRSGFLENQAYAEMQRVAGQVDVIEQNHNELVRRVSRLESATGQKEEVAHLKAELAALKESIAALDRKLNNQRAEIVKDLTAKLEKMMAAPAPTPAASRRPGGESPKPKPTYNGPVGTYPVQSGDSLFLIARAFGTTVQTLKELNHLKNDNLRVGQELIVPKPKD